MPGQLVSVSVTIDPTESDYDSAADIPIGATQTSTALPTTSHSGRSGYTTASRTRTRNGPCAGSMPARASSHVSATVSGHGGQGTNSITMAYISEAMCSVRRRGRQRATVQPSNTQPHQSRCENKTVSTRTGAARADNYPSSPGKGGVDYSLLRLEIQFFKTAWPLGSGSRKEIPIPESGLE